MTTYSLFCFIKGYWGCAIGKAKQAAKTEIEKLQVRTLLEPSFLRQGKILLNCLTLIFVCYCYQQMKDMTCRELVKEVAKM